MEPTTADSTQLELESKFQMSHLPTTLETPMMMEMMDNAEDLVSDVINPVKIKSKLFQSNPLVHKLSETSTLITFNKFQQLNNNKFNNNTTNPNSNNNQLTNNSICQPAHSLTTPLATSI